MSKEQHLALATDFFLSSAALLFLGLGPRGDEASRARTLSLAVDGAWGGVREIGLQWPRENSTKMVSGKLT